MSDNFHWQLGGLARSRFSALVHLLSIRQGGQMDPVEAPESNEDTNREDASDNRKYRRRFLDRFAELVSRDRGAEHVSCAMLREMEDGIEIWASRNSGLTKTNDAAFFGHFERLMPDVRGSEKAREELWKVMVRFYRPRLLLYIKNLREEEVEENVLKCSSHPAVHDLYETLSSDRSWTDEELILLVDQAKFLTSKDRDDMFHGRAGKTWKYIEFLARLRRAHETFIKCAKKFQVFRSVKIVMVQNHIDDGPRPKPWSLDQLLPHLGLPMNNRTVEAHIARTTPNSRERRTINWARARLQRLADSEAYAHAEVQLILSILQSGIPIDQFNSYMGCSKDSCYMCWSFLKHFGGLSTRGCHSRVYHLWTIPATRGLASGSVQKLVGIIRAIEEQIAAKIREPIVNPNLGYPAESTIGRASSGGTAIISEVTVRLRSYLSHLATNIQPDDALCSGAGGSTGSDAEQTPRQAPVVLAVQVQEVEEPDDLYVEERPPSPYLESHVEGSVVSDEGNPQVDAPVVSVVTGEGGEEEYEGGGEGGGGEEGGGGGGGEEGGEGKGGEGEGEGEGNTVRGAHSAPGESDTTSSFTMISFLDGSLKGTPHSKFTSKKSGSRTPTIISKDSFFKFPEHKPTSVLRSTPGWQRVYQYLMESVTAMPTSMLRNSLGDYNATGNLDEVALSIWALQCYKRFLRSLTDLPISENPKRLFIPPNAAQAIESALLNGYRDSACNMLRKLWRLVSLEGSPEYVIVLIMKKGHWVVHCMDMNIGQVVSYGTYYDSEWTKLQSRAWWPALNAVWPLELDYDDLIRTNRALYHHQRDPPEGNSVAIAAIWYKLLMGIPVQRSIDLPRLRDLIRREVKSVAQRKQLGELRVIY